MGGNDTHDKNGRPYELDERPECLYAKLEELRESARAFLGHLDYNIEHLKNVSEKNIEYSLLIEVRNDFLKNFTFDDY